MPDPNPGALERCAVLLNAARAPDDSTPRAFYVAAARVAISAARSELEVLELNLKALEGEYCKGASHAER